MLVSHTRGRAARAAAALVALACMSLWGAGAGAGPAGAQDAAPAPPLALLAADATHPGVISLQLWAATGTHVVFAERIGDRIKQLGAADIAVGTSIGMHDATTWRCNRLTRDFVGTATLPDQTVVEAPFSVRTPSCAQRFELRVPHHVAVGKVARVRIVDTWAIGGLHPTLCVTPPHGRRSCDVAAFAPAVTVVSHRFRASAPGHWGVELLVRGHVQRASVGVGATAAASKPVPTVLAVGDSTMQGIDSFLSDELGDTANVRSDVRPGTGISHPMLGSTPDEWTDLAAVQAKQLAPSTTVVSIGAAADGFPMTTPDGVTVQCCDEPWVQEYTSKIALMMRTYRRHGHGHVIWLTQPTPRGAPRKLINDAVNESILRAGTGMTDVTILRMDQLFTPNGYSDYITYQGRQLRVRADDGVHLNVAGTALAAKIIARVLQAPPQQAATTP